MNTKTKLLVMGLTAGLAFGASDAAFAQGGFKINQKKLDKVNFYNSPRQVQILDERPMIRDFREAPSTPQMIALPPGPQGASGGYGGNGAGAMGDMPGGGDGGAPIQIPASPGQPAYRTPGGSSLPLPKVGNFGGQGSNIPARGMGPAGALPGGQTTNRLMGKMMAPKPQVGAAGGRPMGMSQGPARTRGKYTEAPKAASYGGGYGDGSGGGFGGSSSKTESVVRGSLLGKTK